MSKLVVPNVLDTVDTTNSDSPDDLFICWGSPEERCKGCVIKFSSNYKSTNILLLRYSGHDSKEREDNIEFLKNRLMRVGELEVIEIEEDVPIPAIKEIIEKIENLIDQGNDIKITIDISTPIKWHLFIMLKLLDLRGILNNIRFLYTEPRDYHTNLFKPLSFGIKEIFPIPLYYGNYDFSNEDLLILILGYEGSRAVAMFENIDPARTLLLIADPPYHPEWRGRTEELNREIINIVDSSEIRYIDSRNPMLISSQLQDILTDNAFSKYNHIISPLGTKPQILGLYHYYSQFSKNTMVLYGAPLRHNELFYSEGIGRTWKLPFEKTEVIIEDETKDN